MKENMPKDLGQWAVNQYQKTEVLQKELLKEQESREITEDRLKSLIELLNSCNLDNCTPKTQTLLNPFIRLNTEVSEMTDNNTPTPQFILGSRPQPTRHYIVEWHTKSWFSSASAELVAIIDGNETSYELSFNKTGFFSENSTATFYDQALAMGAFKSVVKALS